MKRRGKRNRDRCTKIDLCSSSRIAQCHRVSLKLVSSAGRGQTSFPVAIQAFPDDRTPTAYPTRFRVVVCGRSTSPKETLVRVSNDRRHHTLTCTVTRITGGSWLPNPLSLRCCVYIELFRCRRSSSTGISLQVCAGAGTPS